MTVGPNGGGLRPPAPAIVARGVALSYGRRAVLAGLDLEIESGEALGLVGPNGAGKTTLLKVVTGALTPQRGEVRVHGKGISRLPPRDRARLVAMVHQSPAVPPGFTALEVVLMGRNPYLKLLQWEGPRDMEVSRRVMELTETWAFAERPAASLSGGELQRVFIARALAQETPVLVLDEPTAHLDISFQTSIFDLVERVRRETEVTVLVAMHDLTLAAQYCTRIAAMQQGTILAVGEPSQVLTADLISRVFGASVYVMEHPVHRTPVVLPIGQAVNLKDAVER